MGIYVGRFNTFSFISIKVPNDFISSLDTPEFNKLINISFFSSRTHTSPSTKLSLIMHLFKLVYIIFSFFEYNLNKSILAGLSSFPENFFKNFFIEVSDSIIYCLLSLIFFSKFLKISSFVSFSGGI